MWRTHCNAPGPTGDWPRRTRHPPEQRPQLTVRRSHAGAAPMRQEIPMNIHRAAIKLLVPFVALTALPGSAAAGNVKFYPATMCQAQGATNRLSYAEHGAISNNSTSVD